MRQNQLTVSFLLAPLCEPTPTHHAKHAMPAHSTLPHLHLNSLPVWYPHTHIGDNALTPRFTARFKNRRSIIIIMADEESTTPPPPPPPAPAADPITTAAATAAATASSWFGSLGADIGKALETAREQVVKAAEVIHRDDGREGREGGIIIRPKRLRTNP